MEGQDVFKAAVRNLASAATAALHANGLTGKDVDWVVAHQANLRILQAISQRLEIPMERGHLTVAELKPLIGRNDPTILEIGANVGQTTEEFLREMPGCRISTRKTRSFDEFASDR